MNMMKVTLLMLSLIVLPCEIYRFIYGKQLHIQIYDPRGNQQTSIYTFEWGYYRLKGGFARRQLHLTVPITNKTPIHGKWMCILGYNYTIVIDQQSTEYDLIECDSSPCLNGLCVDQINGYICECEEGYIGDICQTDMVYIDHVKRCSVSSSIKLSCMITGEDHEFLPWEYLGLDDHVRYLDGNVQGNTSTLTIHHCSYEDMGEYRCRILLNPTIVERNISLIVEGEPECRISLTNIEESPFYIRMTALHLKKVREFEWKKDGYLINETENKYTIIPALEKKEFYQHWLVVPSHVMQLRINTVNLSDYGIYTLTVWNDDGNNITCTANLQRKEYQQTDKFHLSWLLILIFTVLLVLSFVIGAVIQYRRFGKHRRPIDHSNGASQDSYTLEQRYQTINDNDLIPGDVISQLRSDTTDTIPGIHQNADDSIYELMDIPVRLGEIHQVTVHSGAMDIPEYLDLPIDNSDIETGNNRERLNTMESSRSNLNSQEYVRPYNTLSEKPVSSSKYDKLLGFDFEIYMTECNLVKGRPSSC